MKEKEEKRREKKRKSILNLFGLEEHEEDILISKVRIELPSMIEMHVNGRQKVLVMS